MNYFLVLYKLKTCIEVQRYPTYADAEHRLEKLTESSHSDVTGTVFATTGEPDVKVGDTLAHDGTDSYDSGYLA